MGQLQKKHVPIRINGTNIPNLIIKLERKGLQPWEIITDEQENELIIDAIERFIDRPITEYNEIMRRIDPSSNFVEYKVIFNNHNNNYNNNNNNYNNFWIQEGLNFNMRRGGKKNKRTIKKRNTRRKITRKQIQREL